MSDPPVRLVSALEARYRIERQLGEGGMATVYLARDLKHDRDVAIKVLKPELAAVLGAERFVQEITTTASLQHPNILPLFDSGTADGFLYYVMPYVEGESLRDRLDHQRQLGVDAAVKLVVEVADALHYAHEHGVVHRDIKPENILLHAGRPMVADFGIALAVSAAAGGRMTETGLSLGTPHYMSPEQATAEKEITGRSDIYSLASVLYEMLTGDPPHTGASAQQIIVKIIADEPRPVEEVRKSVPPNVAAALAKALEKLPADRFQSAKAFAEALADPGFASTWSRDAATSAVSRPAAHRRRTILLLAGYAVLAALAITGWLRHQAPPPVSRQRVTLWQSSVERFLSPGVEHQVTQAAIAPDGSSVVFSDSTKAGMRLYRKRRGEGDPAPLEGTAGAMSPFFSPDGVWVGYVDTDGRLRKMPVSGGGSITLATDAAPASPSGAWLDDGTIVYVDASDGLSRVAASAGTSHRFWADSSQQRLRVYTLASLPASRGVLFTGCAGNCTASSGAYVFDFSADSARLLVPDAVGPLYSPTGQLLYTDRGGGLYAAEFDPERLALTSGAVPVIDSVVPATFTLSASGTILYLTGTGGAPAQLTWVARDGHAEPLDTSWIADFNYPALSPDGRSLAVSASARSTQLWIRRVDGTRQQLTDSGSINWRPSWAPDGRSLAFSSNMYGGLKTDGFDIVTLPADGSAPPTLLQHYTYGLWEVELSRDGKWLVLRSDELGGQSNIHARRLKDDTTLQTVAVGDNVQAALSPDGKWLAYTSSTTPPMNVYVTSFPDGKATRRISNNGGSEPRWAHTGRELFYESGGEMMAVDVTPGPRLVMGVPHPLFSIAGYRTARNRQQYDVAPDDRHFVMIRDLGEDARGSVVYVENWFQELRARMAARR